jgi:hypothetical protein
MDTGGAPAARPWIEAANPTHPSLIDQPHVVSTLYNMVNVPSAVWIAEDGRIVRPTEPAGTSEAWRIMDRTSFTMPPERLTAIGARRRAYTGAIRDWVQNGDASPHALAPDEVRARSAGPTAEDSLANANFRLAVYLHCAGKPERARAYFDEAKRLRPESWNFRRQAWSLEDPMKAGGPEFWAAVDELGSGRYYPEIEMQGLPDDPPPVRP